MLLELAVMSEQFSERPSSILGIYDETVAFSLDLAASQVLYLTKIERENRRDEALYRVLAKLLGVEIKDTGNGTPETAPFMPPFETVGSPAGTEVQPIFVNGQFMGYRNEAEYASIELPVDSERSVWWETKPSPRNIRFSDSDVV